MNKLYLHTVLNKHQYALHVYTFQQEDCYETSICDHENFLLHPVAKSYSLSEALDLHNQSIKENVKIKKI
jgi:hypothetical protein